MTPSGPARFALLALFAGATGIACSPIFVRLSELGPSATAFHRVFLALPLLWLWLALEPRGRTKAHRTGRSDGWLLILAGVLFAGDLGVWHWSIAYTSVANATLFATSLRSSSPSPPGCCWASASRRPSSAGWR